MKFYYPIKLYVFGLFINLMIIGYGALVIYKIVYIERHSTYFVILYLIFVYFILKFFIISIKKYSNRYIEVNQENITFVYPKSTYVLNKSELKYIIDANHLQLLKMHNVIHIFGKDNQYFYVTAEMNKFKKFKEVLNSQYGDFYVTKRKVIKGFPTITLQLLLKDSDYNRFF